MPKDYVEGVARLFGYITPCKAELRMKEFEAFRAVYCGLCHQLGKSFGPVARLTLSYDFVFLAMLAYSQAEASPQIKRGRCACNPLKRVPLCCGDDVLAFSADAAALMIYYNLLDKIEDSGFFSKIGYSLLRPLAANARRSAGKRQPRIDKIFEELSVNQRKVEAKSNVGIDEAAEPSAKALAELSMALSESPVQKRVLERLGYLAGRYIYLCDALDDIEDDLRDCSFNPLVTRFFKDSQDEAAKKCARDYARDSLMLTIGEAGQTMNLLEMSSFAPVLENIIYLGMAERVEKILKKANTEEGAVE